MTERTATASGAESWTRHETEQRRRWLDLTYHQRLLWLAQAKAFRATALVATKDSANEATSVSRATYHIRAYEEKD